MSERTYSPSYDLPESEGPRTAPHKWNHFEVRALVCLIIKGEHKISKDPMHITDILNRALNPATSGNKPAYNRDIPHDEVQAMLKRILLKKMHAVDVSERNARSQVTRVKVNAFMRNLGFNGSEYEWESGREKKARVENHKRLKRYKIRKEGRRPSPRSQDETDRRRMLLRDPRAKRLLRGWGIGASFWEGGSHGEHRLRKNKNKDRDSSASSETVVDPANIPYISGEAPTTPTGCALGRNDNSVVVPNNPGRAVATWPGTFAPAKATPLTTAIAPASMYGAGVSQHATMLDRGSYGGFDGLYDLQEHPYQWDGGEQDGVWY